MKMRKLFAGLAAAATLLGGLALGAGTANAADPTVNGKNVVTSNATFKFTATDADQWGTNNNRVIRAYKIGDYVKYGTGTDAFYAVATPTYPQGASAALKTALNNALTGKGENGADVTVPDGADPLAWALQNGYLDESSNAPYVADDAAASSAGTTRKLADALQAAETAATTPDFTVTTLKASADTNKGEVKLTKDATDTSGKTYTASLPAGIYLFLDVTTDGGHIADGTNEDQNKPNAEQTQGRAVVNSAPIILASGTLDTNTKKITNPVNGDNSVNFKNHVTPVTKSHDDADNTVSTGQVLNYTLQSTVPAFITGYDKDTYTFQLTDTPGAGQNVDLSNISVKVGGTDVTAYDATTNPTGYELTLPQDAKNNAFSADGTKTFVIDLSKYVRSQTYDASKNNEVVVTYKATITATASSAGTDGVTNKVEVNDNNNKAIDQTKVTLGKFSFTKTDAQGKALAGAKFTIAAKANDANAVAPTTTEATSNANGVVTFDGLADGVYTVTETKVPDGYLQSGVASFEVTIKGGKAVYFNGTDAWGLAPDSVDNTTTGAAVSNYAVKNVRNVAELPKTGAAGIAMFTVIGLLLAGAATTVYVKSRKASAALRA